jgi:hypothetical protein
MPTQPPLPPRQEPLTIALKGLRVVIPTAALVLLALVLAPGLAYLVLPGGASQALEKGPVPLLVPPVPLLSSAPMTLPVLAMVLPGKLPPPGPNQLRAGKCNAKGAEVELSGGCWLQTTTPPPCPEGIQWEHEGKCWRPVAEAKPVPTTGEPRSAGVAGP